MSLEVETMPKQIQFTTAMVNPFFSSVYIHADNLLLSTHEISMIQMLLNRGFGTCSYYGIFWNSSIHCQVVF